MARPTDALRADYEGQRRPNWQAYIFGDLFGVAAERDAARAELARLSAALDGSMALLRKLSSEINDEGYYGWAEGVQAEIDALARIDKEAHDG